MSMRVWKIDPGKSAYDNLWSAIEVAVRFFIGFWRKRVYLTEEEWDEFFQEEVLACVRSFMKTKVGPNSSYSKEHCFYMNCRSVVLSRFYRDLEAFQDKWIRTKMNSIDRIGNLMQIEGEEGNSIIEYDIKPMPKYVRNGERSLARQDLASWLRGPTCTNGLKFREQELADEIEEARLELFGEDYKPTDWKALREKRASLKARLENENSNCNTGEGIPGKPGPGKGRRSPYREHARKAVQSLRQTKHGA